MDIESSVGAGAGQSAESENSRPSSQQSGTKPPIPVQFYGPKKEWVAGDCINAVGALLVPNFIYIYGLLDNRDSSRTIHYVGQTGNPEKRFIQHLKGNPLLNRRLTAWATTLPDGALELVILKVVGVDDKNRVEQQEIEKSRVGNPTLFNSRGSARSDVCARCHKNPKKYSAYCAECAGAYVAEYQGRITKRPATNHLHLRYHVKRGIVNPRCDWCVSENHQ